MWRNKSNSFRTDEDTNLTRIPTLLRWRHNVRNLQVKTLEEGELLNEDYLEWFFFVEEDFSAKSSSQNVQKYQLKYYKEFRKFIKNFNRKDKELFVYFYGEKNEEVRF